MNIDSLLAELLKNEGGYVNDPKDPGGETNFGITKAVAVANGYTGDMKALPKATALDIYRNLYFVKPGFAAVFELSPGIAAELFDTGVNMGPAVPASFLQRCLNALNRGGKDYPDLAVDGRLGPASIAALKAYLEKRGDEGESVMLKALNALQAAKYIALAEANKNLEAFVFGWISNRVNMSI